MRRGGPIKSILRYAEVSFRNEPILHSVKVNRRMWVLYTVLRNKFATVSRRILCDTVNIRFPGICRSSLRMQIGPRINLYKIIPLFDSGLYYMDLYKCVFVCIILCNANTFLDMCLIDRTS